MNEVRKKFSSKRIFLGVVFAVLFLFITGCVTSNEESSSTATESTNEEIQEQATTLLEEGEIDAAVVEYKKILTTEPNNPTANFVVGVANFLDIIKDDDFRAAADKINAEIDQEITLPETLDGLFSNGITIASNSVGVLTSNEIDDALSVSQTFKVAYIGIEDMLIPLIDSAINSFETILNLSEFRYTHTLDSESFEIDKGEIYALYSIMNLFKSIIHQSIAYDWETSDGEYEASLQELFDNTATFGILRDGDHMPKSFAALEKAVAGLSDGLDYILEETDDQSNDIIIEDNLGSIEDIRSALDRMEDILAGPYEAEMTFETYATADEDNSSKEYTEVSLTLSIDLKSFMTNPIQDYRPFNLPDGASEASDFPDNYDFTFNGFFPEMTTFDSWETFFNPLVDRNIVLD